MIHFTLNDVLVTRRLSREGKAAATRLLQQVEALDRYFRDLRSLGMDARPLPCHFLEDVLQPALQFRSRNAPSLARMSVEPQVRSAPRVWLLPGPAQWALALLFTGLRPSVIDCTAESQAIHVVFRLGFRGVSGEIDEEGRRRIASLLSRSGVLVGEDTPNAVPLSITLRLERTPRA
jgi:hypothetical protein